MWRNSMNYGAYSGLAMIVIFLAMHYAGVNSSKSSLQWLTYVPLAVLIFLGMRNLRDNISGGFISYGKALGSGVLISFFGGILVGFFMYVFMKVIDTDQKLLSTMLEQNEQAMLKQNLSEEQIEQSMEIAQKFMTPGVISVMSVFGYTLIGLPISLVAAFFIKREDKSFDGFIKNQGA
jgi:hypothetical protein